MKRLALAGAALAALAPAALAPAAFAPAAFAPAAFPPPPPPPPAAPPAPPPLKRADVEQQLREQFTRLDANHDGTLTRQEADADTGQRGPGAGAAGGPGRTPTDDFFDRLDTNHDNMLSREEFGALRTM